MFLGPLEQAKPWDTKGIDGVNRFLKRFWKQFFNREGELSLSEEAPSAAELKVLHKLIKKVGEDIENFSFNTSVSAFMIALNELQDLKCRNREILESMVILLSPFTPHICEELWSILGHKESISFATMPEYKAEYTIEQSFTYPVSFNGKLRYKIELPKNLRTEQIEKIVRENENTEKYLGGKAIKKVIVVPDKIINVVC